MSGDKDRQRRILLERQSFQLRFDPERDAIPEHVQMFVTQLMLEIETHGYAIWRDNLYDPPEDLPFEERQKYYCAYAYLELLNGITTTQIRNLRGPIVRRAIHENTHHSTNVFYKLPASLPKAEILRLFRSEIKR